MRPTARLAALLAVVLAGCGQETQVSGGSGTSTGNGLTALVLDSAGSPVEGARVVARRAGWTGLSGAAADSLESRTDAKGAIFLPLVGGDWVLEARGTAGACARRVLVDSKDTARWTARLAATSGIAGRLPSKYGVYMVGSVRVCVLGLGRCAVPDSMGAYALADLPVHASRVAYLPPDTRTIPDTLDGIRLEPRVVARLDSAERVSFEDDFKDGALSAHSWNIRSGDGCPTLCQWGNGYLTSFATDDRHLAVDDSGLRIRATRELDGQYLSGSVEGRGLRDFTYGRFEIEARVPTQRGVWTLLSLFPTGEDFGAWPRSGSIDIASLPGLTPDTLRQFAHYSSFGNYVYAEGKTASSDTSWSKRFHRFACEWSKDGIRWFVDDSLVFQHQVMAPFDRPFHFQIELHVGGVPYGPPDSTTVFPAELRIRKVRVVQPWS